MSFIKKYNNFTRYISFALGKTYFTIQGLRLINHWTVGLSKLDNMFTIHLPTFSIHIRWIKCKTKEHAIRWVKYYRNYNKEVHKK